MLLKSVMPRFITYITLEGLRRIKKYLSRDSLLTLIHAFITRRLDYCNGLLHGLPNSQIVKLQRVQNAAARLVLSLSTRIFLLRFINVTGYRYNIVFILRS